MLYDYTLLWVLLWATLAGLFIQVPLSWSIWFLSALLCIPRIATSRSLLAQILAVRLALATGMHLARVCRNEYPSRVRILLWIITEAAIVCSDIPEVIGEHREQPSLPDLSCLEDGLVLLLPAN